MRVVNTPCVPFGLRRPCIRRSLEFVFVLVHHAVDEFPELSADLTVRPDVRLLISDVDAHVVDVLSHLHGIVANLNQHEQHCRCAMTQSECCIGNTATEREADQCKRTPRGQPSAIFLRTQTVDYSWWQSR